MQRTSEFPILHSHHIQHRDLLRPLHLLAHLPPVTRNRVSPALETRPPPPSIRVIRQLSSRNVLFTWFKEVGTAIIPLNTAYSSI